MLPLSSLVAATKLRMTLPVPSFGVSTEVPTKTASAKVQVPTVLVALALVRSLHFNTSAPLAPGYSFALEAKLASRHSTLIWAWIWSTKWSRTCLEPSAVTAVGEDERSNENAWAEVIASESKVLPASRTYVLDATAIVDSFVG